jgi:hypothetical protein
VSRFLRANASDDDGDGDTLVTWEIIFVVWGAMGLICVRLCIFAPPTDEPSDTDRPTADRPEARSERSSHGVSHTCTRWLEACVTTRRSRRSAVALAALVSSRSRRSAVVPAPDRIPGDHRSVPWGEHNPGESETRPREGRRREEESLRDWRLERYTAGAVAAEEQRVNDEEIAMELAT